MKVDIIVPPTAFGNPFGCRRQEIVPCLARRAWLAQNTGMSGVETCVDHPWGLPPWCLEVTADAGPLPGDLDVAIVGGGLTGLAAACWLGRLAPGCRVAVLEANRWGDGGSGRSGGIVLDESAAGELPGLGDVFQGFVRMLAELEIDCDLELTGAWEIARRQGKPNSPIAWQDSGTLRVVEDVPGGTLDPGRLLSELARVARAGGACLYEQARVRRVHFDEPLRLELARGELRTRHLILATNGINAEPGLWPHFSQLKFTVAVATTSLADKQLKALGLAPTKPFYTLDLPYLWGRLLPQNRILFGSGLVHLERPEDLAAVDIRTGEAARLLESLESRVRGLHSALGTVQFSHRWGGPILFAPAGRPIFCSHPRSERVLALGGYTGQGIALSVYLARWAAEALLGRRPLPAWGRPKG